MQQAVARAFGADDRDQYDDLVVGMLGAHHVDELDDRLHHRCVVGAQHAEGDAGVPAGPLVDEGVRPLVPGFTRLEDDRHGDDLLPE